jgi:septal ring factor EnvC (AmiA/AmiB activator)
MNAPHLILIIGFDIIIVAILGLIFFRSSRARDNVKQLDMLHLKSLYSSLEKAMSNSEKVSNERLVSFDERIQNLNKMLKKIGTKQKILERYIVQAEEVIATIDYNKQQAGYIESDHYKRAADLISKGISIRDVQKQSGLSLSEIDLIKQLTRHRM